jgi:excisionase family DNA binding protein
MFTTSEAARQSGYEQSYIRKLIRQGKLAAKRVGHFHIIAPEEVARLQERPRSKRGRPRKDTADRHP